jgi:hypothetical protein
MEISQMNAYEDMLIEAIDLMASQELPDDQLGDALLAQAWMLARLNPEEIPSYSYPD